MLLPGRITLGTLIVLLHSTIGGDAQRVPASARLYNFIMTRGEICHRTNSKERALGTYILLVGFGGHIYTRPSIQTSQQLPYENELSTQSWVTGFIERGNMTLRGKRGLPSRS